jgi:hypothetical protein
VWVIEEVVRIRIGMAFICKPYREKTNAGNERKGWAKDMKGSCKDQNR